MENRSYHRSGHLVGRSRVGDPGSLEPETYDVGLFVSAWEERCTAVTLSSVAVDHAGLLAFTHEGGARGVLNDYASRLQEYVRSQSHTFLPIEREPTQWERLSQELYFLFEQAAIEKGRPIRAFVDISCCPKYYFLSLLGACVGRGLWSAVRFFYAEGKYERQDDNSRRIPLPDSSPEEELPKYVFTRGGWETVPIPGFYGWFVPDRKRVFLTSLGFEGEKVYQAITGYDPDRLAVLWAEPGFSPEYAEQAKANNWMLVEAYQVPKQNQYEAEAGDAIAAWQVVDDNWRRRRHLPPTRNSDTENLTYLCFGTKPHALGLGLSALSNREIQYVYSRPHGFARKDAHFRGRCWVYDIYDLSVPGADYRGLDVEA